MITARQARALPATLRRMGAETLGSRVLYRDEVGSTQDALMQTAAAQPDGTVLVAGRQTAGRGRMGRVWASPPGTLTFSVLLRPSIPPDISGVVMLAAAVSLHDTVSRHIPDARLEWPNDIMADGKLAGIVLDSSVKGNLEWVVVGVGVNVSNDPRLVDEWLASDASFGGADSTSRHAHDASAYGILAGFLYRLDLHHTRLKRDTGYIIHEYTKRCHDVGRTVCRGDIRGTARGVDSDGALLVETGVGTRRVVL